MEIKKTIRQIQELISYSIASIKIRKLEIEEKDGIKQIRPNIHLMLCAPTGSMKSTILKCIKTTCPAMEADSITVPGMIGTIDNNMITPGFAWTGRNKLLLFDEFNFKKKEDNAVMFLKLLEDQNYSKKFGRFTFNQKPEQDKDLFYKAENGSIEIKTRFSAVIATMKRPEFQRGENFKAFLTRVVPFPYKFTLDEQSWLLEHTKLFTPICYKPPAEAIVKWNKYRQIKNTVKKIITKHAAPHNAKDENFSRLVGDAIRLHAIKNNLNKKEIENIINWKLGIYSLIGKYYIKATRK